LDCLKGADTGANIHTSAAMTLVDMSKIIYNHLYEDIRLYPDGNLNASLCLIPSFLNYVSLKRLIIDGASIVMSNVHVKYFAQGTTKLHKSL
jgi:hypothetical protein